MALFRCGGGILTKTLLWSESNPSANQDEKSIVLSQPANNFDALLFIYTSSNNGTNAQLYPFISSDGAYPYRGTSNNQNYIGYGLGYFMSGSTPYTRRVYFTVEDTNWTKMYMNKAGRINGSGTSTAVVKLLKIYGVKGINTDWLLDKE